MRKYLKKLRESADMTQEDVSKHLEISRAYYVRIENGERQKDLDLSIVIKLSELFNVTVDWIAEQEKKYTAA
ncbi:MAG: helix-turn-helix transcriptional regulator [Oscillospiraceae bacterium]|nr:helix-turn-helix transcriptional regulator [Oscillospiraceae bacterium]